MTQIINARGWECPKPIIATKQFLDTIAEGIVCTIVDNKIALDNLLDFAQNLGYTANYQEKDNTWEVTIIKPLGAATKAVAQGDFVVVISTDQFGGGDPDFCAVLMKSYIYALAEASPKPTTIIFINKGVFFTCEGSEVEDIVKNMASEGVEIISCGACLSFYGLTERLSVGTISNMYNIVTKMNTAAKTIRI